MEQTTPLQAVRELIEQTTTLADPAERDRAFRDIEDNLFDLLSVVATYRGDTQVQMGGDEQEREQTEPVSGEDTPEQPEPDSKQDE